DGTMQLAKRLYPEELPSGVFIPSGSSVEVYPKSGATKAAEATDPWANAYGLVMTSDGLLGQIDLSPATISARIKPLIQLDQFAVAANSDSSPRLLKFDLAKRTVGVVGQGYRAQIRRPSNGRRGGSVIRSLSLFQPVEAPAAAVVRLGRNKIPTTSKVFTDVF